MRYKLSITIALLTGMFIQTGCKQQNSTEKEKVKEQKESHHPRGNPGKIQVALLLDTSSSMDGLIEQAKSRLWNIINTLSTLRYNGKVPVIEIALYEYGNMGLSPESDYIRQISVLTTDMDLISEQLFSLRTNGGDEYCGAVIHDATKRLEWGNGENDMRLVYIAGNEPFTQGSHSYKEAISDARKKGIYINTIYCGTQEEGINGYWKYGAELGQGNFFTIDQNEALTYIETPFDAEIAKYNDKINATYIGYGSLGETKKSNQLMQDENAEGVSYCVAADRTVTKSNAAYSNVSWDLVDRVNADKDALKKIKKEELPEQLRSKPTEEVEQYVAKKAKERAQIQKTIGELGKKRQQYIDQKSQSSDSKDDLGKAIRKSIVSLAVSKGYEVER